MVHGCRASVPGQERRVDVKRTQRKDVEDVRGEEVAKGDDDGEVVARQVPRLPRRNRPFLHRRSPGNFLRLKHFEAKPLSVSLEWDSGSGAASAGAALFSNGAVWRTDDIDQETLWRLQREQRVEARDRELVRPEKEDALGRARGFGSGSGCGRPSRSRYC